MYWPIKKLLLTLLIAVITFGTTLPEDTAPKAYSLSFFKDKDPVTFEAGVSAYNTGQFKAALKIFHSLETFYHQNGKTDAQVTLAELYYYQAITYAQLRDYISAQNYYSRVVASFPNAPAAKLAKEGLDMLPHLKSFGSNASQNKTLTDLNAASTNQNQGLTNNRPGNYYGKNSMKSGYTTLSRELPPLVSSPTAQPLQQSETDEMEEIEATPQTVNRSAPLSPKPPANNLSPQEVEALQKMLRDYQSGKLVPKESSQSTAPQPTTNANTPQATQPAMDPAVLMMMQSMMANPMNGFNATGGNGGGNNMMNPMMMGMQGGKMDPNVMSQMMMNQMMGSFDFGSGNNQR